MIHMPSRKTEIHYDFPSGTEHATRLEKVTTEKVGLYAASFDPVHAGHIVFALKAQKMANLDKVCFLPERKPRHNQEPEHYVHRAVMLKHALKPHRQFAVLDVPDARLSAASMPRLRQDMPVAEFTLLTTASELLWHQGELPRLYTQLPLVIAVTGHAQLAEVLTRLNGDVNHIHTVTFVDISKDHISSAAIRTGLRRNQWVKGLLPSVVQYARHQWLYIAPHRS